MSIVRKCKIENRYGFHIRPTQRFSQLAKAFDCEVEVTIRGKTAPGKSIFHLMGLKGKCGLAMEIQTSGWDERQAANCLGYLVKNHFFVEDELGEKLPNTRHYDRLATFAGFFDSEITALFGGESADAKDRSAVEELGFMPWEKVEFEVQGDDKKQARTVLDALLKYNFFCEEDFSVEENRLLYTES